MKCCHQRAFGSHHDDANDVVTRSASDTHDHLHLFTVIDEFNRWRKQPDLAEAVATILALASVIPPIHSSVTISVTAGCDLFMRYVTRTSALEYEDFSAAKS
ncbi:Eukaryotic translation initiation factor 2B (eIF-2B) family protein [Thalictrum thalictroides]|uniref:Eukaryotic translation initiation factor 2B (eIF-2B) family protein n=1 Tax=Thalictrum thalictroides TaxID=46969 RepID=A0A7J6WS75_THATH|nr:Eukaryotic translation initiation factor 2B (eIF-2B) family protein [Thalictrum thalictroides]